MSHQEFEELSYLEKILSLVIESRKTRRDEQAKYNEQIIDQAKQLFEEYPFCTYKNDLCDFIANLPQVETSKILELKEQEDDCLCLGL